MDPSWSIYGMHTLCMGYVYGPFASHYVYRPSVGHYGLCYGPLMGTWRYKAYDETLRYD